MRLRQDKTDTNDLRERVTRSLKSNYPSDTTGAQAQQLSSCLKRDDSRSGALSKDQSIATTLGKKTERDERRTPIESTAGRIRITYREDDAPVGDGSPEVGRLGAHWAVQERLERRRHGGQAETRPAGRRGRGVRGPWRKKTG